MTKNVLTIDTPDGTATIDSEVLAEFNSQSIEVLAEIAALQEQFKGIVEDAAEATGLKKAKISKYFKSRFDRKTKETKELGILFGKLDESLDGGKSNFEDEDE